MLKIKLITESNSLDWKGCLMLSTPNYLTDMITVWSSHSITEDDLADDGRETYSHCTVLYGFSQDTCIENIQSILNKYENISVTLGKIKRFPASEHRPNSDCLVIGVTPSPELIQLHEELKKVFNVETGFPTYNPHITLAYIKPGSLPNLDNVDTFDGFGITLNDPVYSKGSSENRSRSKLHFHEFTEKFLYD